MMAKRNEVVINTCNGGFSLSVAAKKKYLELCGITPYVYVLKTDANGNDKMVISNTVNVDQVTSLVTTEYCGESTSVEIAEQYAFYGNFGDIDRDDPKLIKTVRDLQDMAHGVGANLAIVKVPSNGRYTIEENDGFEWIEKY